jgi:hypothetical protein
MRGSSRVRGRDPSNAYGRTMLMIGSPRVVVTLVGPEMETVAPRFGGVAALIHPRVRKTEYAMKKRVGGSSPRTGETPSR